MKILYMIHIAIYIYYLCKWYYIINSKKKEQVYRACSNKGGALSMARIEHVICQNYKGVIMMKNLDHLRPPHLR